MTSSAPGRVELRHLEQAPHVASIISSWIEHEWYRLPIHEFFDAVASGTWERTGLLPRTLVALSDSRAVGTASIVDSDMDIRLNWSPWLACVYVSPDSRKQGIASKIVEAIVDFAQDELDIKRLYLYTDIHANLYRRLGWVDIDQAFFEGADVTIMCRQLKPGTQ